MDEAYEENSASGQHVVGKEKGIFVAFSDGYYLKPQQVIVS